MNINVKAVKMANAFLNSTSAAERIALANEYRSLTGGDCVKCGKYGYRCNCGRIR